VINFSPAAAARIAQLRATAGVSPELHVRIRVVGGGCAGFSYDMYFDRARPEDAKAEAGTESVLLDAMTIAYMSGTTIDVGPQGFVFQNPHAQVHCNCGASFRTYKT